MAITSRQRLELFLEFIREQRYVDLHTLARRFDVSLSTVRRALNDLENEGAVRRHHGGVSILDANEDAQHLGYDFITQDDHMADEKHAIADYIVDQVKPGMTVLIDGGTTTFTVARKLAAKRVILITNSLPIAALFNEVSTSETIVTGGTIYNRLGVLYGPTCENTLAQMHADIAILGGAGMTPEGLWNSNSLIAAYQRRMMEAADATVFALDHSKLGRRALTLTTGFRPNLSVVTSAEIPASITNAARDKGARLVVTSVSHPKSEAANGPA